MESFLNEDQQKRLLSLARQAISFYLEKGEKLKIEVADDSLIEERGVFVTLKVRNELRGCIGYPLPYKPLFETIIDAAVAAAAHDFRFQSLEKCELQETRVEISVLSPPRAIEDVTEIQVGEHGIVISKGGKKGLLLPQVPIEWGWDRETFLEHGCLKAGLEENAWEKGANIEIFSAQVFSE
jgi:AmmeMemoRadiSam system protein A